MTRTQYKNKLKNLLRSSITLLYQLEDTKQEIEDAFGRDDELIKNFRGHQWLDGSISDLQNWAEDLE